MSDVPGCTECGACDWRESKWGLECAECRYLPKKWYRDRIRKALEKQ